MTHAGLTVAVLDLPGAEAVALTLRGEGAEVLTTANPNEAVRANGLVIPGAGTVADTLATLSTLQGARVVGQRLAGARPVFALGSAMDVLFEQLLDDDSVTTTLGEWPGAVVKRHGAPAAAPVEAPAESAMFRGVDAGAEFEFTTDAVAPTFDLECDEFIAYPHVSWARVGAERIVAAVENGPLWAAQFLPERSGEAGRTVLRNWLGQL